MYHILYRRDGFIGNPTVFLTEDELNAYVRTMKRGNRPKAPHEQELLVSTLSSDNVRRVTKFETIDLYQPPSLDPDYRIAVIFEIVQADGWAYCLKSVESPVDGAIKWEELPEALHGMIEVCAEIALERHPSIATSLDNGSVMQVRTLTVFADRDDE